MNFSTFGVEPCFLVCICMYAVCAFVFLNCSEEGNKHVVVLSRVLTDYLLFNS